MKKTLFSVLLVLTTCFTACANEKVIPYPEMPLQAQRLIETHFSKADVSVVMMDRELLSTDYEVRLNDGTKVEFDKSGELTKIDCGAKAVPEALIPEAVRSYVTTNFPNTFITEWGKDDRRWKAELNNGLDLEFNSKYEFLRIDD
ncbi:MAG: PepSY-like domain-containing protein [Paludibacteraceae bacterium]|nr:PepSY-like domain-containing protein [Paludibacteraceae bacterium]MBR1922446.1 PepSY-like domain-containing protein [Paludibacteraceae bacterium]